MSSPSHSLLGPLLLQSGRDVRDVNRLPPRRLGLAGRLARLLGCSNRRHFAKRGRGTKVVVGQPELTISSRRLARLRRDSARSRLPPESSYRWELNHLYCIALVRKPGQSAHVRASLGREREAQEACIQIGSRQPPPRARRRPPHLAPAFFFSYFSYSRKSEADRKYTRVTVSEGKSLRGSQQRNQPTRQTDLSPL